MLISERNPSHGILMKITNVLSTFVEDSLHRVYTLIGNLFADPYSIVSRITQKFYKYFHKTTEAFLPFVLYSIRLIILSCFLLDVFYFFQLKYMYYALYLLCFSLIIKILIYIMRDFSGNLDEAISVLIIENKGIVPETQLPRTVYSLKPEYSHLALEYHVGQFILCSKITGYLANYDHFKKAFDPYFNILIYFMYFIGWFYILFENI